MFCLISFTHKLRVLHPLFIKPLVISNGPFEFAQGSDTGKEMKILSPLFSQRHYPFLYLIHLHHRKRPHLLHQGHIFERGMPDDLEYC